MKTTIPGLFARLRISSPFGLVSGRFSGRPIRPRKPMRPSSVLGLGHGVHEFEVHPLATEAIDHLNEP